MKKKKSFGYLLMMLFIITVCLVITFGNYVPEQFSKFIIISIWVFIAVYLSYNRR